jgi:hypothetical protein
MIMPAEAIALHLSPSVGQGWSMTRASNVVEFLVNELQLLAVQGTCLEFSRRWQAHWWALLG